MRRDEVKTIFSVYQIWLQEGRDAIMAKRPEDSRVAQIVHRRVQSSPRGKNCPTILHSLVGTSPPRELIRSELSTALAPARNVFVVVPGRTDYTSVYLLLVWLNFTTISLSM